MSCIRGFLPISARCIGCSVVMVNWGQRSTWYLPITSANLSDTLGWNGTSYPGGHNWDYYPGTRARINSWIELELIINSIQFSMNWIGIELKDFELELNWNWKPELIRIDQFNQFIFNSTPHFTRFDIFSMTYHGNCSVTSSDCND